MLRFAHASNMLERQGTHLSDFVSGTLFPGAFILSQARDAEFQTGGKGKQFHTKKKEKGTHGSGSTSSGSRPDDPPGGIVERTHRHYGADGPYPLGGDGNLA